MLRVSKSRHEFHHSVTRSQETTPLCNTGLTCAANLCIAQQEVDRTDYLLKSMSIPLSKQITLVKKGRLMIAAIEAHSLC